MLNKSVDLVAKLRAIGVFQDFTDEALQHMIAGVTERRFQPGQVVVREGDPGEELFLVEDGDFQVFVTQSTLGIEREVSRIGPGGYFGEIAVISGNPRLASIRSVGAGRVWVFQREQLLDLIKRSPSVALGICRRMASYLEQARQEVRAVPFVTLDRYPGLKELQTLIPPRIAALCQALVIAREADEVTVALVNPYEERFRAFLQNVLRQYRIEFVAMGEDDYLRHRSAPAERKSDLAAPAQVALSFVDSTGKEQFSGQHETADLLQTALGMAIRAGASDVHFEPGAVAGRVRLRIDGNMFPLPNAVPPKVFAQVVSRLKVMSDLDITIRRLPQDGRFPLQVGDRRVEVRVSVTPCQGGEKVVLRLLDPQRRKPELSGLMHSRAVVSLTREMFVAPSGLVLVCGPTGSGKTTTLYAGLNELWSAGQNISIVTVEDPVEYQLEFATQIGVDRASGLGYPQILRTVLRQDPDVLLIGEIRDEESAAIAIEAALTGHLVLSSLHTDTALDSIARLRNLQVKPYLLAAVLRGVICQRLVPQICQGCSQPITAADEHVNFLRAQGILEPTWTGPAHRGLGCDVCRATGELGRAGVYEILTVNDGLRNLIEKNASWAEMSEVLTPQIFIPMTRYGRFLIEEGVAAPERIREFFPGKQFADVQAL